MAELEYLSYSRLTMYACPYRFQQHYLRGAPDVPGRAALLGGELHRLIAEQLSVENPTAKVGAPDPRDIVPPPPDVMTEAADMFADWQLQDPLAGMTVLAIEWPIEIELPDMSMFRGRLDVICEWHDMLVVWDWKSSRHMPASLGNDPQLATYALLAGHEAGLDHADEVLVRQYYTRFGRHLEAQVSSAGRSNVYATLAEFAQRLSDADPDVEWPAYPCESCTYCALTCPLPLAVIKPPQTVDDATWLAERAVALEAQASASKSALRAWCAQHGPITGAGRTFELHQSMQETCGLSPRELVERFGEAAWDWLTPDHKRIGKATPEDAGVMTKEPGQQSFTSRKEVTT